MQAELGAYLRTMRRARNLTQEQLAAAVGQPQTTISAIEAGKVDVRASVLCRLARVLGTDPGELIRLLCAGTEDAA